MKVLHHLRTAYGRLGPAVLSASLSNIDTILGTSLTDQSDFLFVNLFAKQTALVP